MRTFKIHFYGHSFSTTYYISTYLLRCRGRSSAVHVVALGPVSWRKRSADVVIPSLAVLFPLFLEIDNSKSMQLSNRGLKPIIISDRA